VDSSLANQAAAIKALQEKLEQQTKTANEALLRATTLQTQHEEQLTTQTTMRGMIELSLAAIQAMNPVGPAISLQTYGGPHRHNVDPEAGPPHPTPPPTLTP